MRIKNKLLILMITIICASVLYSNTTVHAEPNNLVDNDIIYEDFTGTQTVSEEVLDTPVEALEIEPSFEVLEKQHMPNISDDLGKKSSEHEIYQIIPDQEMEDLGSNSVDSLIYKLNDSFIQNNKGSRLETVVNSLQDVYYEYSNSPYIGGALTYVETDLDYQLSDVDIYGITLEITTLQRPTKQADGTTYISKYNVELTLDGTSVSREIIFTQSKKDNRLETVANSLKDVSYEYNASPYIGGALQYVKTDLTNQLKGNGIALNVTETQSPIKQVDGTTYISKYNAELTLDGTSVSREIIFTQSKKDNRLEAVANSLIDVSYEYNTSPYIGGALQYVKTDLTNQLKGNGIALNVTETQSPIKQVDGTTYISKYNAELTLDGTSVSREIIFTQSKKDSVWVKIENLSISRIFSTQQVSDYIYYFETEVGSTHLQFANPHGGTVVVTYNGQPYPSFYAEDGTEFFGYTVDLNNGLNTFVISVTSADGMTAKTYTIDVIYNPSSRAEIRFLHLSKIWSAEEVLQDSYSIETEAGSTNLQFENPYGGTVVVTYNGQPYPNFRGGYGTEFSGATVDLNNGLNTFVISVTSADGMTTKTHTIDVIYNPSSRAEIRDLRLSNFWGINEVLQESYSIETEVGSAYLQFINPYSGTVVVTYNGQLYHGYLAGADGTYYSGEYSGSIQTPRSGSIQTPCSGSIQTPRSGSIQTAHSGLIWTVKT